MLVIFWIPAAPEVTSGENWATKTEQTLAICNDELFTYGETSPVQSSTLRVIEEMPSKRLLLSIEDGLLS